MGYHLDVGSWPEVMVVGQKTSAKGRPFFFFFSFSGGFVSGHFPATTRLSGGRAVLGLGGRTEGFKLVALVLLVTTPASQKTRWKVIKKPAKNKDKRFSSPAGFSSGFGERERVLDESWMAWLRRGRLRRGWIGERLPLSSLLCPSSLPGVFGSPRSKRK